MIFFMRMLLGFPTDTVAIDRWWPAGWSNCRRL